MRRIEDHCVCCDIHCIDCGLKRVVVYYCDKCLPRLHEPLDDVYEVDGKHLCEYHLLEMFRKEDDEDDI